MRPTPALTPDSLDARIAALADRQFGVIARRQLIALGLDASAIARRVRAHRLRPLHRGVYAVGHTALRREGWWMAAVLTCGEGAVLSHRTAATVHGMLPHAGSRVHVSVPGRGGRRRRPSIAIHRPRLLTDEDVTDHDGLPVTTVGRTLVDLAEAVPSRTLQRALDASERLRLDAGDLDRYATRGGAAKVQTLVGALAPEHAWTRSALEDAFLRLCAAHALPRPEVNAWVAGMEVDFSWDLQGLVVETDGHAHHHTRRAFEDDHRRTLELRLAGYEILRFTHRQVEREPAFVARAVRTALTAAAPEDAAARTAATP